MPSRRSQEGVVDLSSTASSKAPKRLYEIVEETVRVRPAGPDPLEEALRAEEEELAREAKRLRLQELIMQRMKRIKELERELAEEEYEVSGKSVARALSGQDVPPELAIKLAEMPEEQRQKVIQAYAQLKAASALARGDAAALVFLPFLMGYATANPSASVNDMVSAAKAMADAFIKGFEAARQAQGAAQHVDPVAIINTVMQGMKDLEERFEKAMREIAQQFAAQQPQRHWLEAILEDDKKFDRFRQLFGHAPAPSPELQLEIEKLRQQTQLELAKMQQEQQRWMAEMRMRQQQEQQKWETVKALMEGKVGSVIERLGAAAAEKVSGVPASTAPSGMERVVCPKCGGEFYVPAGSTQAVCPFCRTLLRKVAEGSGSEQVGGSPAGGPEAETASG